MFVRIPPQPTAFIGREAKLRDLKALIETPKTRLVSILGPSGVGKTRLAVALAEQQQARFQQGVYFLPLLSLNSWDQVVLATAQAPGFEFYQDTGLHEQLIEYLHDKCMLLVFDNFEHLLSEADRLQNLPANAPQVTIMLTSREKLNLRAETTFLLNSFEVEDWPTVKAASQSDAIQLFIRSAQRVQTQFSLTQANLASVTRICRLVEGMPLAIELAAVWVDTLTTDGIADEIARNSQFLEMQSHDIPEWHRSMWITFQSSCDRLETEERISLGHIAIFSADFTYSAPQAVAGITLRTLQRLISKSLLNHQPDRRYHMHSLLRQYLTNQLSEAELKENRRVYSQYYLAWLHDQEAAMKGSGQRNALDSIEKEFDNIRSAWPPEMNLSRRVQSGFSSIWA